MIKSIKILTWVPHKIWNYTKSINIALEGGTTIKDATEKTYVYVTKLTGATTGAAGLAKGSSDLIEAIACQDKVCPVVSTVGCTADSLQILASFVPGPNVTTLITTPVSVGCKVFVWCCQRSKLPWGSCH
jgi:hypothetical protein